MTLIRMHLGELGRFRISITLELFARLFYLGEAGEVFNTCHILSAQAKLFSLYPFGPFSGIFSLSLHFSLCYLSEEQAVCNE